jgi:hypothetical protein
MPTIGPRNYLCMPLVMPATYRRGVNPRVFSSRSGCLPKLQRKVGALKALLPAKCGCEHHSRGGLRRCNAFSAEYSATASQAAKTFPDRSRIAGECAKISPGVIRFGAPPSLRGARLPLDADQNKQRRIPTRVDTSHPPPNSPLTTLDGVDCSREW